jgi:protocatechuate 3,4-dioxygenase beta subunit
MTGTDGTPRNDQTPEGRTPDAPETTAIPEPYVTPVEDTTHDATGPTEAAPRRSRRLFIGLGVAGVAAAVVVGIAVGARSVFAAGRRGRHGDTAGGATGQAQGAAGGPIGRQGGGGGRQRDLTPAVADADADGLTPPNEEGPYFKANSPERASLVEATAAGTHLILTGKVVRRNGTPVAKALLDFWQANPSGQYDNRGYDLRGHQFTAADGTYRLETVVPGLYPGRTRHIHVKVQAPGESILTTQLYFPDEVKNGTDGIYDPRLLMKQVSAPTGGPVTAMFDFVISG